MNKILGQHGESIAEKSLINAGFKILHRNFKNKIGEIDFVAQDGKVVVFVEVKTRTDSRFGQPFEAVHYAKRRKLTNLALSYLKFKFQSVDVLSRFDVISIQFLYGCQPEITHIKNAFDAA